MRAKPIAGNSRDGKLYSIREHLFEGDRLVSGGKFETRRFQGSKAECVRQWQEWQDEAKREANITIQKKAAGRPREGSGKVAATQKTEKPSEIYVLAFVDAYEKRTDIGAYISMDKAADMVDALTIAAKATGQKGEYDVFKLEVRG